MKGWLEIMIIYKTTNKINGKIYVGQHYTNEDDGYLGSGMLILKAIKKYGRVNFVRETLCECKDQENLNIAEIYWISQLSSTDRLIGYNLRPGGLGEHQKSGHKFGPMSDENKLKLSNKMRGKNTYTRSAETRQRMSIAKIGREPWNKGKTGVQDYSNITDEHRNNISKALTIPLDMDDIIARRNNGESMIEIAKVYNVCVQTILRRINELPIEVKKSIPNARKGVAPWNKGATMGQNTKEHNENIAKSLTIQLDVEDIVSRRDSGERLKSIAKSYDVSVNTIERRINQYKLDNNIPKTKKIPLDMVDVISRRNSGESFKSIAESYGVCKENVQRKAAQYKQTHIFTTPCDI